MRKKLGIVLAMVMLLSSVAMYGCGESNANSSTATTTQATQAATENTDEVKDEVVNYATYKEYKLDESAPVKNIILLIGDGMGTNHIKSAEIDKGDKLAMECMPYTAMVTTSSLSGTTDSAAAATAMSTGEKVYNKSICVDKDGNNLETMCQFAQSKSMKTGVAVTHIVNHATPAGFTANSESREMYKGILNSQIENGINVLFGGGQIYYSGKLQKVLDEKNYQYVSKASQLDTIDKNKNVLGLFKYQEQIAGFKPYLASLATKATELLENDNGFFLMVEGSLIDVEASGCHMNAMLREMATFDQAVDACLLYAQSNPGTLVLVTADHETGGIVLPENATKEGLTDDVFTSGGEHTDSNVKIFAAGAQADKLFTSDTIDNTDIAKLMRKVINESHTEIAETKPAA